MKPIFLATLFSLYCFVVTSQPVLSESFESDVFPPQGWKIETENQYGVSNGHWLLDTTVSNAYSGRNSARIVNPINVVTSWMFTNAVNMQAGAGYRISFYTRSNNALRHPRITVYRASGQRIQDTTGLIGNVPAGYYLYENYRRVSFDYYPTISGNQYLSFCSRISSSDASNYWMDSVVVEKIMVCAGTPVISTVNAPDSACPGTSIVLHYDSVASNEKYQWQIADIGTSNWTNMAGVTLAHPTVVFTKAAQYRCQVACADGSTWTSSNTVQVLLKAVACPCYSTPVPGLASGPNTACNGDNIALSCSSTDAGISAQWQYFNTVNSTWTDIVNAKGLTVAVVYASGRTYRCKITCDLSGISSVSNEVHIAEGQCSYPNHCTELVYPRHNQQMVSLYYDSINVYPNATSNGIELKWKTASVPLYVYLKAAGQAFYTNFSGPVNPLTSPFQKTSDSSVIIPAGYNVKYYWFVADVNSSTLNAPPVRCSYVDSFTTAPAPPVCKPACGNVYIWDFQAFRYIIPGRNNNQSAMEGFACLRQSNSTTSPLSELMQGKSYPVKFWTESYPWFSVWIDFNDNGMFEAQEQLLDKLTPYSYNNLYGGTPAIVSLYIPANAPVGVHRIRVKNGGTGDACSGMSSGSDGYIFIVASDNSFYSLAAADAPNTCNTVSTTNITASSNNNNDWLPLVDSAGSLVAAVKANGNNLGAVIVKLYKNSGAIRTLPNNVKVLDRSIEISVGSQPTSPVDVRIYFSDAEFNALKAADNSITDLSSLNISKFTSGCGQVLSGYNFIGQSSTGTINGYHYIEFSTIGFSDFYIRSGTENTLPVQLVHTSAQRKNNDVVVSWETTNEYQNKGFDIEFSTDAIHYRNIAFVASKANLGNAGNRLQYNYRHLNPGLGSLYYRIRQLDINGTAHYSAVMKLSAFNSHNITVNRIYPNPAKDKLLMEVQSESGARLQLDFYDMAGKKLRTQYVMTATGEHMININLEGLPRGIFLLSITNNKGEKIDQLKFTRL